MILPLVRASCTATCVMVPQLAVATGHSIAAVVVAVSPVTLNVAASRTYPPPDTSVPVSASVGSDVNRPRYQAVGRVTDVLVNSHSSVSVSYVLLRLISITPYQH